MHISHRGVMMITGVLLMLARATCALDYQVLPIKPTLVADERATWSADYTDKPDGVTGVVEFPAAGNIDLTSFTIEIVLRAPEDYDGKGFGGWSSGNRHYRAAFSANEFRLYGWGDAMREHPFLLMLPYSGNGYSIVNHGLDKWLYLAVGVDLKQRRSYCVLRDAVTGDMLANSMQFASAGTLNTEFTRDMSPEQKAAAIDQCWRDMMGSIVDAAQAEAPEPDIITLGHPQIALKAARISRGLREDVLIPQAQIVDDLGMRTWDAAAMDAQRAVNLDVQRELGYQGYRNHGIYSVSEPVVPLRADAAPIVLSTDTLPIGVYSFYLFGTIDPQGRDALPRVWRPTPMRFEATDDTGRVIGSGHLLLKQSFTPIRLQGFHLHIDRPTAVTAKFWLDNRAMETARLTHITLVARMGGLPDVAIKSSQNLATPVVTMQRLDALDNARKDRDDLIWRALPPLNLHLQVHGQAKPFREPPPSLKLPTYQTAAFAGKKHYYWHRELFSPLDMTNTETGEVFAEADILAGKPWPGDHADDGTGIYLTREQFPDLKDDIYLTPRAELLGRRVWLYKGILGAHDYRAASIPKRYFESGDAQLGHDAAMALARFAYDWAAVEMNLHEIRLCTHAPDLEYNQNWSQGRRGKYHYAGWAGSTYVELLGTYDQIFPYIKDNQVFADALNRFIPWVKTPNDVVRFFDRYLVWSGVRDFRVGRIRAAPVEDVAGQVLGPSRHTTPLFDLTRQHAQIYPFAGTYQELYASALDRHGTYHIGSFMVYGFGVACDTINKAHALRQARLEGVPLPMDLSDVARYRKVRGAGRYLIDMFVAGGFPFMIGDASGGPHTGLEADKRLKMAADTLRHAFELEPDPRIASVLKHRLGSTDEEVLRAAGDTPDPMMHNPSRVVPGWGAIVECNVDATDPIAKTAATLALNIGQGHSHNDFLDLNLFSMGLPMSVDLACRSEGNFWSRPSASWSFLHNHAIAHANEDPKPAGGQSGEPFLRAFAPPVMRASYVDQSGDVRLDRDVVLTRVGDSETWYAFDLQRLRGDQMHTWCFHGCESDDVDLNISTEEKTVRWVDRTLTPHKYGLAGDSLQATWRMTREGREVPHQFMGGGIIQTAACEPVVLRDRYDESLPPVHVRATLLGRAGDTVMTGRPFSQQYQYAFPFLWVQAQADGESVYPAVYEWYRGDEPVIAEAKVTRREPLSVTVRTTSGQVDTYTIAGDGLSVVSIDANGVRWMKMVGMASLTEGSVSIVADHAGYSAAVTDIDYVAGHLTTDKSLPTDPGAVVVGDGRHSYVYLQGSSTSFKFDDSLLMHEGSVTKATITNDALTIESNQRVFHADAGNRKMTSLTQTNESGTWHQRAGRPVKQPANESLSPDIFTDANGDGFVNVKTYEFGIGDTIVVPTDVELRRGDGPFEVKTNVDVTVEVNGSKVRIAPSKDWQPVRSE